LRIARGHGRVRLAHGRVRRLAVGRERQRFWLGCDGIVRVRGREVGLFAGPWRLRVRVATHLFPLVRINV
jgi:hypothetical protein